jgi:hypothetical protein
LDSIDAFGSICAAVGSIGASMLALLGVGQHYCLQAMAGHGTEMQTNYLDVAGQVRHNQVATSQAHQLTAHITSPL